jgi:hypothetical protein
MLSMRVTRGSIRPDCRPSNYPTGDRVSRAVAQALGLTEGSAHQLLYGASRLNVRAAKALRAIAATGDRAARAHFLAPILAAVREIPADVARTAGLQMQAQTADLDEEAAEKAYDLNPCHATAGQLIRARDLEAAMNLEDRMALARQWDLA